MKTITRAKADAKALRLLTACDVQLAAAGLGNRNHRVHPDSVRDRISEDDARRQFERAKVAGSHPQVAVPILRQRPNSPAGQPVVLGPHACWRSVRGKLGQTSIHSHPDVAFPRFEYVEDATWRRPAALSGEPFES